MKPKLAPSPLFWNRDAKLSATALVVVCLLAPASTQASEVTRAKPSITSVGFDMLESASPVVVIRGSGFGTRPAPNPRFRPAPPKGNVQPYRCTATGKVGWDYGDQLWISLKSQDKPSWSPARVCQEQLRVPANSVAPLPSRFRLAAGSRRKTIADPLSSGQTRLRG